MLSFRFFRRCVYILLILCGSLASFGFLAPDDAIAARAPSKRQQWVGATPSKTSLTGRTVLKRWASRGKAQWHGPPGSKPDFKQTSNWKVFIHIYDSASKTFSPRQWVPLGGNVAMGHKLASVDFYQKGAGRRPVVDTALGGTRFKAKYIQRYAAYVRPGYIGRARGAYIRTFMKDPDNYRFEHLGGNSSLGASMSARYTTPPQGRIN